MKSIISHLTESMENSIDLVIDMFNKEGIISSKENQNGFDYIHVPGDELFSPATAQSSKNMQQVLKKNKINFKVDKLGNLILTESKVSG